MMFRAVLFALVLAAAAAQQIGNAGPECAFCGFAMNELEGFLIENRTQAEMEQFLGRLCARSTSPVARDVCEVLAYAVPHLIEPRLFRRFTVARVCFDLKLCNVSLVTEPDAQPMATSQLNLDLPPRQRWTHLCSRPEVRAYWGNFLGVLRKLLPVDIARDLESIGRAIWVTLDYEVAQEIQGCADQIFPGQSLQGTVTLVNLGYELSDACTSIVARSSTDGTILHARNMDFGMGGLLTSTMRNITTLLDYTRGGHVVARQVAFIGFVGMLSGQRVSNPSFAVTVNTRFYPGKASLIDMLTEAIYAIKNMPNVNTLAALVRNTVLTASNFSQAVQMLSTSPLIVDVYFTVSGVGPNEGVVITRNRTGAVNLWPLTPKRPYVFMTNYDHDKPAPWFDDRKDVANAALAQLVRAGHVDLPHLHDQVLSVRPVLNLQTAYTLLACNANHTMTAQTRYCPFPCAE